jgi:rubrerythrin
MSSRNGNRGGTNKDFINFAYVKITMQDQMAAEAAMAAKAKAMAEETTQRRELQSYTAKIKKAERDLKDKQRARREYDERTEELRKIEQKKLQDRFAEAKEADRLHRERLRETEQKLQPSRMQAPVCGRKRKN